MRTLAVALALLASRSAAADFANNEAIHAHVDATLRAVGVTSLDARQRAALHADRLTLSLGALVPVLGTYRLDEKVFGSVRPAGVIFDWVLGGLVPATLGLVAWQDGALSSHTRSVLAWTALGLYASTRLGVLVIGNWHVSEYNHYLDVRLAAVAAGGPGLSATVRW
ncbi:MAG: hypothetical protein ACM31C_17755 [Acidobacteriota bacterium]